MPMPDTRGSGSFTGALSPKSSQRAAPLRTRRAGGHSRFAFPTEESADGLAAQLQEPSPHDPSPPAASPPAGGAASPPSGAAGSVVSPPSGGVTSSPPVVGSVAVPSSAAGASELLQPTPNPASPAAVAKISSLFFNPVFMSSFPPMSRSLDVLNQPRLAHGKRPEVVVRHLLRIVQCRPPAESPSTAGRYSATVCCGMGDPLRVVRSYCPRGL